MKRILIVILMLCPVTIYAQQTKTLSGFHQWDILGEVHAGASISTITKANADPLIKPTGGVAINMMVMDNVTVDFEMNFHWLGGENRTVEQTLNDGNVDRASAKVWLTYLDTEYHIRGYIAKGLSIYTGMQMGTLLYAKAHADDGRHANFKDDCRSGRFAVPVGITKDFGRFFIDARGYYQVNKTPKNARARAFMSDGGQVHNAQVTIGYRFQIL